MNNKIDHIVGNIRSVFIKSPVEQEIHNSIRELKRYTDSELNDIGVSRMSIEACVRGNAANTFQKVS